MNLVALVTDNITEALIKIVNFTQTRQKLLIANLNNLHQPDFVPKDLAVEEFSQLMTQAIDEHIRNQRLLLRDTKNFKFGFNGSFKAVPLIDGCAKELLDCNKDKYLKLQIDKLLENSLNQRIAMELLKNIRGDPGFRLNPN